MQRFATPSPVDDARDKTSSASKSESQRTWTWPQDERERLRIVLVAPNDPRNVGGVARVTANFGVRADEIVLVRSDDVDFDREQARVTAPGLDNRIEQVRVVDSLEAALGDCVFAIGFTARLRKDESPTHDSVLTPFQAARELRVRARVAVGAGTMSSTDATPPGRPAKPRLGRVAAVFGPERSGLAGEHLARCHAVGRIPTASHTSLNLAQAVAIICYEWFLAGVRAQLYAKQGGFRDLYLEGDRIDIVSQLAQAARDRAAAAPGEPRRGPARETGEAVTPEPPADESAAESHELDAPAPAWAMELALVEARASLQLIGFFAGGTEQVVMQRLRRLFARGRPTLREARLVTAIAREVRSAMARRYGSQRIPRANANGPAWPSPTEPPPPPPSQSEAANEHDGASSANEDTPAPDS